MKSDVKRISDVVKRPGIPVLKHPILNKCWVVMWIIATILVFLAPKWLGKSVLYSQTTVYLSKGVDMDVELEGCDILFEKSSKFELRLGYWTFMGSGSVETNGSKVSVKASMSQKLLALHCLFIVMVPDIKDPHFHSLNITVSPTGHALTAPRPANVAEMISVDLENVHVNKTLKLNISTMAQTTVHDVVAEGMDIHVQGGSLLISDGKSGGGNVKSGGLNISANNVMILVQTQHGDLDISMDADTANASSLAAAALTDNGNDNGTLRYHLSSGGGGGSAKVHIEASDSATYVLASDTKKGDDTCPKLQVNHGDLMKGPPRLTDNGETAFKGLKDWLQDPSNSIEFVVYIHFATPVDRFSGILKLVSAEIYTTLSPVGFALLSGGSMEPFVIRMALPVLGMDWDFPNPCNGDKDKQALRFGKNILAATDEIVDVSNIGQGASKWVWEAPSQEQYIFDHVAAKNGRQAHWRPKPVSSVASFTFHAAGAITICLGLILGIGICRLLYAFVRPAILDRIRKSDLFATASYRLQHTNEAVLWTVAATFVQWPMAGVLMRWKLRPMQVQFAKMEFSARPWPLADEEGEPEEVWVKDIQPFRLPTFPGLPDQRTFLFSAFPGDEKSGMPWFPEAFDTELYATGMLQWGVGRQKLKTGKPYQFQIVAKNAAGAVLEKSQWSRPTIIQPERAFVEYPLLLWRSMLGKIPGDTFSYFLSKHCLPIEASPGLRLNLTNFKVAAVNDSPIFFGVPPGVYGAEEVHSFTRIGERPPMEVSLAISAGGNVPLYETTKLIELPSQTKRDAQQLKMNFDKALPGRTPSSFTGLEKSTFIVLDWPEDTIDLAVSYDPLMILRIEAAIATAAGQQENTAKIELSWPALLDKLSASMKKGNTETKGSDGTVSTTVEVPMSATDLVLRDGLTPCGVLSFECKFTNSGFGVPKQSKAPPPGTPDIFGSVLPGASYIWGEPLTLSWSSSEKNVRSADSSVDIVLVSHPFNPEHSKPFNKNMKHQETEVVVAKSVNVSSEKITFFLSPNQSVACQMMRCRLEARAAGGGGVGGGRQTSSSSGREKSGSLEPSQTGPAIASSWDFGIIRPVTLQQLELNYAAFSIRNRIPMQPVAVNAMRQCMIETAERKFNYCTGYRPPLPLPAEIPDSFDPAKGPCVVENPSSLMIVGERGLCIEVPGTEENQSNEKPRPSLGTSAVAAKTGASAAGAASSTTPLLEEGKQGQEPPKQLRELSQSKDNLVISTNVFWNWQSGHHPEFLLQYWCLPPFAEEGYLARILEEFGWIKLALWMKTHNPFDDMIRFILGILMYYLQMFVMGMPAMLLFGAWLWHDTVLSRMWPDLMPREDAHQIFLIDFVIAPSFSRWRHIDIFAKVIYIMLFFYAAAVSLVALYCNFVRSIQQKEPRLFKYFNAIVAVMWLFTLFACIVLFTVVLVWIIMGALVNPVALMPYAIMIIAVVGIYIMLSGKMTEMKDHVVDGIRSSMDYALQAIFDCFVNDPTAAGDIDEDVATLTKLSVQIAEWMSQNEKKLQDTLLEQGVIQTDVEGFQIKNIDMLRASAEFTTIQGMQKNKILLTDFIPGVGAEKEAIQERALKLALNEATIDGTNEVGITKSVAATAADGSEYTKTFAAGPPPIKPVFLGKAIAASQDVQIQKPGQLSDRNKANIAALAGQLNLRIGTATSAINGYILELQRKRQEHRPSLLNDAGACAGLFTRIRHERLFNHFTEFDSDGPNGKEKDSCVRQLLHEIQRAELGDLSVKAATALTAVLDWVAISRNAQAYVLSTLEGAIINRAMDESLSSVQDKSVAYDLCMQVYELAFSKWDSVYKNDPTQVFVDCGVVEYRYKYWPATKSILQKVLDGNRAFTGDLYPGALIGAVKMLCLPEAKPPPLNDIPAKTYLWYGALTNILKKLGWSDEEMEPAWLGRRWREVTEGTGLFGYESDDQLIGLILGLSNGGLWKAATKGLMFNVKVGGYVGCDVQRDGLEAAAKAAHALMVADPINLEAFVAQAGAWPDYVEDAWRRNAQRSGSLDPTFLPIDRILDFLRDVVYLPVGEVEVKLSPLSAWCTNPADLQWKMGTDKAIWHSIGGANKRLRGIWLELALQLFTTIQTVPTDLDIFYQALDFQEKNLGKSGSSPWLRLEVFRRWLKEVYYADRRWTTFSAFKAIMQNLLRCDLPEGPLLTQVFQPCPKDPDDDLGELRRLSDLGGALFTWMGYGLWPAAMEVALEEIMPRGQVRTVALSMLDDEFKALDPEGLGILQPAEAVVLLHRLCAPGLTCEDMTDFVSNRLGMQVPDREMHKYFAMMDVNGDGVLQADEFIPMFVYLTFDFFPHHVLRRLNLSTGKIVAFILCVLLLLGLLFALITLVISAFPTGKSIAATLHSGVSGMGAVVAKQSSDKSIGAEDSMATVKKELELKALLAVVSVLGLSKAVYDNLTKMMGF